jgi:hypothetical protein
VGTALMSVDLTPEKMWKREGTSSLSEDLNHGIGMSSPAVPVHVHVPAPAGAQEMNEVDSKGSTQGNNPTVLSISPITHRVEFNRREGSRKERIHLNTKCPPSEERF